MHKVHPLIASLAAASTLQLDDWRDRAVLAYLAGQGEQYIKIDAGDQPLPDDATPETSTWSATFDCATYITWQIRSSEKSLTNRGPAAKYAAKLKTCGRTDWRVPEAEELESLRRLGQRPAKPDPKYFPGIKADYHWSSSPIPGDEDYARVVSFFYGFSFNFRRSYVYPVLACCGGVVGAAGVASPGQ